MNVELREPKTEEERTLYYDLRWRILREPWTTLRESGTDEHENDAIHLTAWSAGQLVGVGRLHFNSVDEAQVRCMAVEEGFAGQGVGSAVLHELERRASQLGAKRMVLSARESAIPFYTKRGYETAERSSTLFESIVHWWMRKEL